MQITFASREVAQVQSSRRIKLARVTYNLQAQSLPKFGQVFPYVLLCWLSKCQIFIFFFPVTFLIMYAIKYQSDILLETTINKISFNSALARLKYNIFCHRWGNLRFFIKNLKTMFRIEGFKWKGRNVCFGAFYP
jgi:hypothetical protein